MFFQSQLQSLTVQKGLHRRVALSHGVHNLPSHPEFDPDTASPTSTSHLQVLASSIMSGSHFEVVPVSNKSQGSVSSSQAFDHHASSFSMPDPDRICYSNKESAKVNIGLAPVSWYDQDLEFEHADGSFSTNKPAVDIDFSQLLCPIVAPESKPSVEALVSRLLNPPPHAFVYRTLSIQWVIGAIGQRHVDFRESDERYVLAQDSELRHSGTALGMPALYMEWLSGDNKDISATDQGVHLTPDYFEEVNMD